LGLDAVGKGRGGGQTIGGQSLEYRADCHTALRRLRFPAQGDGPTEADAAAHAALAALALAAALFQDEAGYFLRSRCDLVPEPGGATWEIVRADGQSEPFEIDAAGAAQLVHEAAQAAKRNGMAWNADDLVLTPQKKLVDLVLKSREKALAGVDEAESGQ
jgi:CRISPR-associated protein Csb1